MFTIFISNLYKLIYIPNLAGKQIFASETYILLFSVMLQCHCFKLQDKIVSIMVNSRWQVKTT